MASERYIYHGAPEDMQGVELIPLNWMKQRHPELYEEYAAKYAGRKEVMERRIPLLDCLWNDVVQFLPMHPQKVFDLQKEMGIIPNVKPYPFFEINLDALDPAKTVVYSKSAPGEENTEVKWLSDVSFEDLQVIPSATIEYYKSLIGTGELPFNYHFIPHILHMGSVNVAGVNRITLTEEGLRV